MAPAMAASKTGEAAANKATAIGLTATVVTMTAMEATLATGSAASAILSALTMMMMMVVVKSLMRVLVKEIGWMESSLILDFDVPIDSAMRILMNPHKTKELARNYDDHDHRGLFVVYDYRYRCRCHSDHQ